MSIARVCIRILMVLAVLLSGLGAVHAQQEVRIGDCSFVPEANVPAATTTRRAVRSAQPSRPIALGAATGGRYNVLLQFNEPVASVEAQRLERAGVELSGYLGGNAYWAQLPEGMDARRALASHGVRSVMATRPEWKASRALLQGEVPPWAKRGVKGFAFVVCYADNASPAKVKEDLMRLGARDVVVKEDFHFALGELPIDSVRRVAELDYVQVVAPEAPENELENYEGARLSGAVELARPAADGGRGLTGKGIRAGIWDGNVEPHPDFSNRVTRMEFESEDAAEHGTHVAGTMFASGLQDERGKGIAPGLQAWTYNFGTQRNGLTEVEEMADARKRFGITLTQHSYGVPLKKKYYDRYGYMQHYQFIDQFSYDNPTVINVFSAGNDQVQGGEPAAAAHGGDPRYGTSTKRAKNVLHIGAVAANGTMTNFSSWGPMDDGRMLPTVCAKGEGVYSTKPGGGYWQKNGTSMACPTASGHIALIQERYKQINAGEDLRSDLLRAALVTGATDAGNEGPDYSYGFGILNAVKTVEILENRTYNRGEFEQAASASQTFTVKVPKGAKSLRVSLAWIDPVTVREYEYGESPMVHDLDLKVTAGGTSYLPLVCDPANAAKKAEQKVDRVNNTEQVVVNDVTNLVGQDITITVSPHSVASGAQVYYVAYHFEREEARVVLPRNGDELAPGESFYLRVEGVTSNFEAEISTDGGKTYRHLGKLDEFDALKPYCSNVKVTLPEDVEATEQAKFRVITADGKVAESEGFVTIMASVSDLTVNRVECGSEGFVLKWKAAGASPEGYVVLRSDAAKGGYEKIAEVADGVTEYELKSDDMVAAACYTVACKAGDGWGRKAIALQPCLMRPIVVKADALPWRESFKERATPYFSVKMDAANTLEVRAADDPTMPTGAHMHLVSLAKEIEEFNYDTPFADSHKKNIVDYAFCGLDMRDVPADRNLMLRVRIGMRWAPVNATRGPWFRVLLDGEPLRDAAGVEVHERLDGVFDLYYPIVGGGEHELAFQFVGKYNVDRLAIYELAVEEVSERRDVGLTLVSMPREAAKLTADEEVVVRLCNHGGVKQERVGLQLLRNGVVTHQTVVESLLPHERREVSLPVDLSTSRALGEIFNIAVRADLPGDANPSDNSVEGEAVNIGSVFAMPRGNILQSPMGPIPLDPKKVYRLSEGERLLFTDDGGALADYYSPQVSTLKVLPSREGRVVRVRFKEFSSHEELAHLLVYNETVPETLEIKDCFFDRELMGAPAMPYSTVSRAADGALTFFIEAHRAGMGWLAEIDEVPVQNVLTIVSATATAQGSDPDGEVPVKVVLRNIFASAVEGITLHYYLNKDHEGEIANVKLEANEENTFEFSKKVPLKAGQVEEVKVWLDCEEDTDGAGNVIVIPALYDVYPTPSRLDAPESPSVEKLECLNEKITFAAVSKLSESRKHFPRYQLADVLTLYKGLPSEPVRLVNLKAEAGDAVRLWIDWNGDKKFEADELAGEFVVDETTTLSSAQFASLNGLAGATPGEKRARIAVGNKNSLDDPAFATGLERGATFDFTVNVSDGGFPSENDLQLKRIELQTADGKQLAEGAKLPSDAKVVLYVQNNGRTPFGGKFKVKLKVDDGAEQEETVDLAARSIAAIPAFGSSECAVALELTADLSAVGKHTVTVTIEEQPSAVITENNAASAVVYSYVSEGKNYALAFSSHDEALQEYLKTPKGYSKGKNQATIEFWAFLNESGFNTFMETRMAMICAFYKMKDGYADNSLGIVLREGVVHSKANTLLPGRWNHIAVVLDEIKGGNPLVPGSCKVTAYINGELQELVVTSPDGTDRLDEPLLGTHLNGMIDEFRLWNDVRTQEEITANMYRNIPPGDAREDLAYEFSFSEGKGNKYAQGVNAKGARVFAELKEANDTRLTADDGLWYELSKQPQLVETNFEGQVKVNKAATGTWVVHFKKGTNLSEVTASFVTMWPCTKVLKDGQQVGAETKFDLSAGKTPTLTFESELFGETYTQTVIFVGNEDLSHACDLMSLTVQHDENPGLEDDIALSAIEPTMVLVSDKKPDNPEKVKIHFELSPGATMHYMGNELSNGGEINLTSPALLTVQAANGTSTKRYSVRLAVKNDITSSLADGVYTYGDSPVPITVSEGNEDAPLASESTDASVASFADGKLHIGRPGEATVSLWQKAEGIYAASEKVTAKITVKKRDIVATPAIAGVEYNQPLQWAFKFEPSIPTADANELSELSQQGGYTLHDAAGAAVNEGEMLLPGTYSVKPKESTVETEKYLITLKEQTGLQVAASAHVAALAFVVTDADGAAVKDAAVEVAGKHLLTDDAGKCAVAVDAGVYTYTVTKEGYQLYKGTAEVKLPSLQCDVALQATKYTLSYAVSANGGGVVYGRVEQRVAEGANGEAVEAVANDGYRFVSWSDGKGEAKRVDRGVRGDVAVLANFEKVVTLPIYTVTYTISGNGMFADGGMADRVYEVREGDELPSVAVSPANSDSYFVSWSDGHAQMQRPAGQKATENLTLTAEFGNLVRLPLQENFEQGVMPPLWRVESGYPNPSSRWKIFKGSVPMFGTSISSRAATIITCEVLSDNPVKYSTSMRLPIIDVSEIAADIKLEFDWMYVNAEDKFSLSYSIDGGELEELWEKSDDVFQDAFTGESLSISKALVEGKKTLEFVFTYTSAEFSFFASVDNVNIYEVSSTPLAIKLLSEPASKATFTHDGAPVESLSVNVGYDKLAGLQVHPVAGYTFKEWIINGEKVAPSDYGKVCQPLAITAVLANENEITIAYGVEPPQAGVVKMNGEAVTHQVVEKGATAAAVEAVPTAGFDFSHWADNGSPKAERTGDAPTSNMQVTAIFRQSAETITFKVQDKNGGTALPGAKIALTDADGVSSLFTTGTNGEVQVALPHGEYSYMVMHEGYVSVVKSSFKVPTATATETVDLSKEVNTVAFDLLVCDAESGEPLNGANVRVGATTANSNGEGIAHFDLLPASYLYSVSFAGYKVIEDAEVEVPYGEKYLRVALQKEKPAHGVSFAVVSEASEPLAGVVVRVGSLTAVTDAAGKASMELTEGTHEYSAQREGYVEKRGTVEVAAATDPVEIQLECLKYTVTITVHNALGVPIIGAEVTLNGQTKRTGASGVATYEALPAGEYEYKIAREGYLPIEGKKLFVVSSDRSMLEVMERREIFVYVSSAGQPVPYASITFTNSKGTVYGPFVTTATGAAQCKLPLGQYEYKVDASGKAPKSGNFNYTDQEALFIDFERQPITLACEQPSHGTLEVKVGEVPIAKHATLYSGCSLTITATPDAGYRLEAITINGRTYGESPVTVEVDADATVKAAFAPHTYPVTYSVAAGKGEVIVSMGGTAIASGTAVAEGAEIVVTAKPAEGFELDYLKANGKAMASGETYVVKAATQIEAAFKEIKKTAVESELLEHVTVGPNPFDEVLILGNASHVQRYTLVSMQGVEVLRGVGMGEEQIAINTAHLASGVYVLTVYGDGAQRQMRVVKMH